MSVLRLSVKNQLSKDRCHTPNKNLFLFFLVFLMIIASMKRVGHINLGVAGLFAMYMSIYMCCVNNP